MRAQENAKTKLYLNDEFDVEMTIRRESRTLRFETNPIYRTLTFPDCHVQKKNENSPERNMFFAMYSIAREKYY